MAYAPNENGLYPPIYPVDSRNEPDYTQPPIDEALIDNTMIRLNGYIPKPTITKSIEVAFNNYFVSAIGSSLSMGELLEMYGKTELSPGRSREENDVAYGYHGSTMGMRPANHPAK